jgi:hypothetical protein
MTLLIGALVLLDWAGRARYHDLFSGFDRHVQAPSSPSLPGEPVSPTPFYRPRKGRFRLGRKFGLVSLRKN